MKKFLGFYLPAFIGVFSLALFLFGYLLKNHPLLLKFPFGYARIISSPVEAVVKINGVEQPESRVFSFADDGGEKLLVYSPDSKETYPAVIVDKLKNDIGITNAGVENYELFFDSLLFKSESAEGIVYASDAKWGHNPKLQITGERISYVTVKYENGKYPREVNAEIILKGAK